AVIEEGSAQTSVLVFRAELVAHDVLGARLRIRHVETGRAKVEARHLVDIRSAEAAHGVGDEIDLRGGMEHQVQGAGEVAVARDSDFTGALNLVFHPTSKINLIANAMRGFRAPNVDEMSRFNLRTAGLDVPNPQAGPEHVMSYELGAKYEDGRLGGSLFYYRNNLNDLLVRQSGTFR